MSSPDVIHVSAILDVDVGTAFEMFASADNIRKWLIDPFGGGAALVEPKVGGKFELFWNADGGAREGTPGCQITALVPSRLIGFNWKGPTEVAVPMNRADPLTHVTVSFSPIGNGHKGRTAVNLIHSGWGSSSDFQAGRAYFEQAWTAAFRNLETVCKTR
jgi:uncharacterized protein YndB with AHSA1/START domain